MPVDAVSSLRPFGLEVTIAGADFLVPAKNAGEWLEVLLDGEARLDVIIPGWTGRRSRTHLYRSILSGAFTRKDWDQLILEVLGIAAGRPWWQAMNLINGMKDPANWKMIFGHLLLRGLDPEAVSLAGWLDATYALCTEHMDKNERIKFDLTIDTPPSNMNPEDVIDPAEQERAFLALMAAVGGS